MRVATSGRVSVNVLRSKTLFADLSRQIGVAVLFFVMGRVGVMLSIDHSYVTVISPPSGLSLVAMLAFGYRMFYGIAIGSFFLNLSLGLSSGVAVAIALCDNLEYLGGAYLLRNLTDFNLSLSRRQDVFALVSLSAILATTFSALPGLAVLHLAGLVPAHEMGWYFLKWWVAGMLGVLAVAPILLVVLTHALPRPSRARLLEGVVLLGMMLTLLFVIFGTPTKHGHGYYPAALAIFPFIIWGALRFGMWGAAVLNPVVAVSAIWGTKHGIGPFSASTPLDNLLLLCLFINVMSMIGLLLAAMGNEQRVAREELTQSRDGLESRVQERTAELAQANQQLKREIAERRHLESELLQADERQQRTIGMELHDGLGQHLTSTAFFCATLHQQLQAEGRTEAVAAKRIVDSINEATKMVRTFARNLYPAVLEAHGLVTALGHLAENTRALQGVSCDFHADPDVELQRSFLAINLYRMAQEAVNNAITHGQARNLRIELSQVDGQYRLTVSDDGVGFDPGSDWMNGSNEKARGMGLHNLQYRASLLDGTLSIHSEPQVGTTVTVVCPVEANP